MVLGRERRYDVMEIKIKKSHLILISCLAKGTGRRQAVVSDRVAETTPRAITTTATQRKAGMDNSVEYSRKVRRGVQPPCSDERIRA